MLDALEAMARLQPGRPRPRGVELLERVVSMLTGLDQTVDSSRSTTATTSASTFASRSTSTSTSTSTSMSTFTQMFSETWGIWSRTSALALSPGDRGEGTGGTSRPSLPSSPVPYFFAGFALAGFSSRNAATQASGAFQLIVISLVDQASMWSTKHFCGRAAGQAGGLRVGILQARVRPARHDARRRRRELGVGLVRPEAVVRVLERALAVAGDVRLIERVAAEQVVHRLGHARRRYLRVAGEVVGQRRARSRC